MTHTIAQKIKHINIRDSSNTSIPFNSSTGTSSSSSSSSSNISERRSNSCSSILRVSIGSSKSNSNATGSSNMFNKNKLKHSGINQLSKVFIRDASIENGVSYL